MKVSQAPKAVDVLSQVAEAFRLRGSVSGVFELSAPWGYAIPKRPHAGLLVVSRGRIHFELEGGKQRALELAPGDVAEFGLDGLSNRAGKRRLGQAAGQLGYRLKWSRAGAADALYFQVLPAKGSTTTNGRRARRRSQTTEPATATQSEQRPPAEPVAAPAPRRSSRVGRPKKQSAG